MSVEQEIISWDGKSWVITPFLIEMDSTGLLRIFLRGSMQGTSHNQSKTA